MDTLVAAAIHDAKNSLNALGVWLIEARREFAARDRFPADDPSPALAKAAAITAKLSGQLVELLALYRAGDGSLRLAVADHDLTDYIADVMAELADTNLVESQVIFETDIAAAAEIGAWAFDAYLVKFVLLDALRNAFRHTLQRVRFSLSKPSEGGILFCIEDDGEGYTQQILRCDSAESLNQSQPMNAASSGLGLSFARLIAARHVALGGKFGRLELANDGLGKEGARFSLFLP